MIKRCDNCGGKLSFLEFMNRLGYSGDYFCTKCEEDIKHIRVEEERQRQEERRKQELDENERLLNQIDSFKYCFSNYNVLFIMAELYSIKSKKIEKIITYKRENLFTEITKGILCILSEKNEIELIDLYKFNDRYQDEFLKFIFKNICDNFKDKDTSMERRLKVCLEFIFENKHINLALLINEEIPEFELVLKEALKFENIAFETFCNDDYDWITDIEYKEILKIYDRIVAELIIIISYANEFIRLLLISQDAEILLKNKELNEIVVNLNQTKLTTKEKSDKIFPLYREFYLDIYNYAYKEITFLELISLLEYKNETLAVKDKNKYGLEEIEFITLKNKIIYMCSIDIIQCYINQHSELEPEQAISNLVDGIVYNTINYNIENINMDFIFEIINNKTQIVSEVKEKYKKHYLAKEKERLLSGDLTKEKEYVKEKFNLNSIADGYEFENYLKNIFEKKGYIANVTSKSKDQGADLIIEKHNEKIVVQAKYYSNPVGNKAVQEVSSAISYYKANRGMVVTNSTYTTSAIELAKANNIELIDGAKLNEIINTLL